MPPEKKERAEKVGTAPEKFEPRSKVNKTIFVLTAILRKMVNICVLIAFTLVHINLVIGAPGLKQNNQMSFLTVKSVQGVSICDQKGRAKDCSSYGSCDLCVACDTYCSWCAIGGMCTRFCEGADGSAAIGGSRDGASVLDSCPA